MGTCVCVLVEQAECGKSPGAGVRGSCELTTVVVGTKLKSYARTSALNHWAVSSSFSWYYFSFVWVLACMYTYVPGT